MNRFPIVACALLFAFALPASAQQTLNGGVLRPGTVPPSALAGGATTPSAATYYRGDGSWQAVTGGYALPVASAATLGGVKIGANIAEAADGTISVAAPNTGTFTPGASVLPSTLGLYVASYSGTAMYAYASAYWASGNAIYAEGGGEMRWQYSTDGGVTYVGIDGTSATDFLTKGSQFWVPHPITTGSISVRVLDVNASGGVTGFVTASLAYVAPTAAYTLPTASTSTLGGVKIDGTTITIVGGVLSAASQTASGTAGGDLTGAYPNPSLVAVGVAGTYGDGSHYPVITTDAKGRVTGVTTQPVAAGASYTGTAPIAVSGTTISASAATASSLGVVQPDGATISVTNGIISAVGGGGGISYLSNDPNNPATGQVWYNSSTHRLKVKEAAGVYSANFTAQTGKPSFGTAIDTGQSISSGLILSYLLAEGSGTGITDSSATGDTGTLSSASVWATDATYTTALTFSGSNWAYFPYKASLNIETYTIALAFKTTSTTTNIMYFWGPYGDNSTGAETGVVYLANGKVELQLGDTTNTEINVGTTATYNDGNWHKVVVTRVKSGTLGIYVDSSSIAAIGMDTVGSTVSSGTGDGRLSGRPGENSGYPGSIFAGLTGSLAYVDVWNRVLSGSEIGTLMADPFAMYR